MSETISRIAKSEAAADKAAAQREAANEAAAIAAITTAENLPDLPPVIQGVEDAIDSKAAAKAAADEAVIAKAADPKATLSNADSRRLARILREMPDAILAGHLDAIKGKRSPLGSAVRTERDRRALAASKAAKPADKPAGKAKPAPAKAKQDKPAKPATEKPDAKVVAMWNEPVAMTARARRHEIAVALNLRGKIAGILRRNGLDADRLPNPLPTEPETAETPAEQ